MNFKVKITGGGTRKEILQGLQLVINSINSCTDKELDGAEWEDKALMTEINIENE